MLLPVIPLTASVTEMAVESRGSPILFLLHITVLWGARAPS